MTMILAIDPGPERSAWVHMRGMEVISHAIEDNDAIANDLQMTRGLIDHLVVEMVASYGMPVGREVFETCLWVGRFIQAYDGPHDKVYRQQVKMELCKDSRAKDSHIRQALIDLYGPGRDVAVGTKAKPGPLYGVKKDIWAALAVGVTWARGQQRSMAA